MESCDTGDLQKWRICQWKITNKNKFFPWMSDWGPKGWGIQESDDHLLKSMTNFGLILTRRWVGFRS